MVGEKLRSLRDEKKLTQEQVAQYLGISRQAYGKYESDGYQADYESLIKLADLYNVSIDYLLGRSSIKAVNKYTYLGISRELKIDKCYSENITSTIDKFFNLIENNINNKRFNLVDEFLNLLERVL